MGHWEDRTDNVCDGYSCGSRNVTTTEWVPDEGDAGYGESCEETGGRSGPRSSGLEVGCLGALSIFGGACYGLYKLGEYVVDLF
jgi:hypothetical protein